MPKFWVRVSESYETDYLVEVPTVQGARDLFYAMPIEEIKKIAKSTQVEHSNWEVSGIRNEDGTPLFTCPECQSESVTADQGSCLCQDCGKHWKPEEEATSGTAPVQS